MAAFGTPFAGVLSGTFAGALAGALAAAVSAATLLAPAARADPSLARPDPPLARADAPRPAQAVVDSLLGAERYDDAIAAARAEIARREAEGGARDAESIALRSSLMLAHFQKGELAAARGEQETVVALRAELVSDADPQLADDFNDLAMICDRLGDDAAAANAWRRSLAILHRTRVEDAAARIVPRTSALAETERRLGRFAECERLLRDAIEISEAHLPRDHRHARLVNNLGALAWDERRYDEATELLREALRITEEDPKSTPLRRAVAASNLANLKREQGETEEAGRLHEAAVNLAREHLRADPQYPIFLKELAVLRAGEARYDEAFALWDEALAALGERRRDLLASEILYERGRAELAFAAAADSASPADVVRRASPPRWRAAEAALTECLAIRREKRRADHPSVGQALAALGALEVHRGRPRDARRRFVEAAAILEKSAIHPEERAEALAGLARLDWDRGRRDEALASMRRALDVLETLRFHRTASELSRADWVRGAAAETSAMIEWLVREGRYDEAIAIGERVRGRILADQLASARVDWRTELPAERRAALESSERDALARIRTARRELEEALAGTPEGETKAPEIEARLEAATHAYRDVLEEGRAASRSWARALREEPEADVASAVRARLADGEMVLVYQTGPEASFVFEIAADAPVRCTELRVSRETARAWGIREGAFTETIAEDVVEAGRGPAPIAGTGGAPIRGVGAARPAAERTAKGGAAPLGERQRDLLRLGEILLPASMRDRVFAAARIHLIPDGILHEVPFEALAVGRDVRGPVYWLDRGPILCYGHSLRTFLEIDSRDASGGRAGATSPPRSVSEVSIVLTVTDPDRGVDVEQPRARAPSELATMAQSRRFHALPGSRREADALVRAFASAKTVRLEGKNAREAAVKNAAPSALVLHFGTHGIVEQERSDLLAALVLAEEPAGSSEDGFLHLFEVYEMRLQSDLVVLSACETKLGKRVRGEGVIALSRGFLAAGARRVVASLWPVDDDATARLMGAFFEGAGRGEETGLALRDAKHALRGRPETSDPFYWAPFVLSGSFSHGLLR